MSYYKGYFLQHGNGYTQNGNGLGNVLSGIVRAAIPIASKTLKGVAKAAGKGILRKGLESLENMDKGIHPLQTSFSFARPTLRTKTRKRKISHRRIRKLEIPKTRTQRKNQKGAGKKRKRNRRKCKNSSIKPRKRCRKRGYKRKRKMHSNIISQNKRRRTGSSRNFDIFSRY